METLRKTLEREGKFVQEFRAGMEGNPAENFREFVNQAGPDLATRGLGDWDDLGRAYLNAFMAKKFTMDLAHAIDELGRKPSEKAQVAGVNVVAGSQTVHSALLLHLRPEPWNDRMAMALARTALESCGRAALIARGQSDELSRWSRNENFSSGECHRALAAVVAEKRPGAPGPGVVFEWLCNFAHMNKEGLRHFLGVDHVWSPVRPPRRSRRSDVTSSSKIAGDGRCGAGLAA